MSTAIQWTDETWNPVVGCSRISEGCRHCYAERQAFRAAAMGISRYDGLTKNVGGEIRWTGEVRLVEEALELPLRWKKPRRVFVNSMSDLFHEGLSNSQIGRVFEVIGAARDQGHVFQVLTKRPERMHAFITTYSQDGGPLGPFLRLFPHLWLGVSCEDQATADARIPWLLRTPSAVWFVSYEPALAAVDFTPWLSYSEGCANCGDGSPFGRCCDDPLRIENPSLSWLIVGGESGPGARPFDVAWARQTLAQGKAAGVPVFVKQLGARPCSCVGGHRDEPWEQRPPWERLTLRDRKGGDPAEWPEDLRVREYPS